MKEKIKKLVLYILCSSAGTVCDFILLLFLVQHQQIPPKIANAVAYITGVVVSFFLCRFCVFERRDKTIRRLSSSILVHIIGWGVQQMLLICLLNIGASLILSKLVTIAENAIVMYVLNALVVFRKYKDK